MKENSRVKSILDSIDTDKSIIVGNNNFGPLTDMARKILLVLRSLPDDTYNAPYGNDKLNLLIEKIDPLKKPKDEINLSKDEIVATSEIPMNFKIGKIRASNFRGLQVFGGPIFEFDFQSDTILISGINGTGKSSILNAIVWAFTGMLLWDRTMPSFAPKIEIGIPTMDDTKKIQVINKAWPSEVSLPNLDSFKDKKAIDYNCWVEIELIDSISLKPFILRREVITTGETKLINNPKLDSLSIELSILMPARVSHVQFNCDSQIGQILMNISGFEPLNNIGIFSKELQPTITKYVNVRKALISKLTERSEGLTKDILGLIPKDLDEEYKTIGIEGDLNKRIEQKQKWLATKTNERLSHLAGVLKLNELPNELQSKELADTIVSAYEPIVQNPPQIWNCIDSLLKAINLWDEKAIKNLEELLSSTAKDLLLALEWNRKKQEIKNLELLLFASKLIPIGVDTIKCPICLNTLDESSEIGNKLKTLAETDENALKSLNEMLSISCEKIKTQVYCMSLIPDDIILQLEKDFESNIGRYLKGNLDGLKEEAKIKINSLGKLLKFEICAIEDIIELRKADTDNYLESYFELTDRIISKIGFGRWCLNNFNKQLEQLNISLGYGHLPKEGTIIDTITKCRNIAISAKPLQDANFAMSEYKKVYSEMRGYQKEIKNINQLKESLSELIKLKDLADELMTDELVGVNDRMQEIYKMLYGSSEFPLRNIQAKRIRRQIDFQFCVEHRGVIIEAPPLINASRVRAMLWSYIFSLSESRKKSTTNNWLDFIILDDPLSSFDEGHRTRFANYVFNSYQESQWIVSSHDTDWPRHIKQWGLEPKINRIRPLSCARDVICLTEWKSEAETKLSDWSRDLKDERLAREFVEAVRVWLEEELKDLLTYCPTSSRKDDDLDSLLKKFKVGIDTSDIYKATVVTQLYSIISKLPKDIHNSHHGGPLRSRIFVEEATEIKKQYTQMSSLIDRSWDDINAKITAKVF